MLIRKSKCRLSATLDKWVACLHVVEFLRRSAGPVPLAFRRYLSGPRVLLALVVALHTSRRRPSTAPRGVGSCRRPRRNGQRPAASRHHLFRRRASEPRRLNPACARGRNPRLHLRRLRPLLAPGASRARSSTSPGGQQASERAEARRTAAANRAGWTHQHVFSFSRFLVFKANEKLGPLRLSLRVLVVGSSMDLVVVHSVRPQVRSGGGLGTGWGE